MREWPTRRGWHALLLLLLTGLTGCGESVGDVSGEVKVKDKPVPSGVITFLSQVGKKRTVDAEIKDGKYTATGVPAGEAVVTVRGLSVVSMKLGGKGGSTTSVTSSKGVIVAGKYGDPKRSGLSYTVTAGEQTKDFTLDDSNEK